ncbi:ribosomal protein S1 [Allocatelliglobosispora scoriae]|uniref:Ribosomal protein S1 n=1 Tax=Allocatelliglobosispora scoriae TaxID=643052 RepID=A0A841C3T9_9ACTN|nr:S1 RNA-binding domain-containing protein [Allocatelliglobosispora scoriae]MBB5874428.1 ribosomal protein S1 [Allocatelliglobosispora scoriae]
MSRFDELNVGDVLVGQVSAVVPFGVFVRIAEDADGLLHGESEPQTGASVTVRILEIDRENRRASLAKA